MKKTLMFATLGMLLSSMAVAAPFGQEDKVFFDESYEVLKFAYPTINKDRTRSPIPGVMWNRLGTNTEYQRQYANTVPPVMSFEKTIRSKTEHTQYFNHCTGFQVNEGKTVELEAAETARRISASMRNITHHYNESVFLQKAYRTVDLKDGRTAMLTEIVEGQIQDIDRNVINFMNSQVDAYKKGGLGALEKSNVRRPGFMVHTLIYRDVDSKKIVGMEYFESTVENRFYAEKLRAADQSVLQKGQLPTAIAAYAKCILP